MRTSIRRGDEGGVLWVDAQCKYQFVRVVGWCRYWVDGDEVGGYNCDEHQEFGGPESWLWDGERFVRVDRLPDEGVPVLVGEWERDEDWYARW